MEKRESSGPVELQGPPLVGNLEQNGIYITEQLNNGAEFMEKKPTDYNAVAYYYTGLNKYIVFLLYCIPISVASSIYFNWSSVSRLLIRAGVYEWHCSEADIAGKTASQIKCEAQRLKISQLLVLTRSCDMVVSALTGFLIDRFSQRYVLLTGNVFLAMGWMLLAFNGKSNRLVTLAFFCIGLCASCVFMSALNVINLFKDNRGLAICFIVSLADDVSTNIPLILNGMFTLLGPNHFKYVCIFYIFFATIPTTIIGFTAMPVKSWTTCIKEYETLSQDAMEVKSSEEEGSNLVEALANEEISGYVQRKSRFKMLLSDGYDLLKPIIPYVMSKCFFVTFICFSITNFSNLLMTNLFLKYYDNSENILFLSEILLSLQFVPGIMLGYLFDIFLVSRVNYTLNVFSFVALILLYLRTKVSGYMFCPIQAMLICVDFSTLMVYINLIFPVEHMSTLTGFTLFLDGIVSLFTSQLDRALLRSKSSAPIFVAASFVATRLLLYVYLHHLMKPMQEPMKRSVSDGSDIVIETL
ncbi:conserved hypothetical protein [Theileria equi strain WA]|uniref:Uncharacterized protein n=1 Tax=Theileria equi strain WA TaxID=1537102 RepID=L1LCR2_THEEQ|nr:conserved hypothetical protein [Theileria equi strain WA]EKX73035.1 conserved hypothetical protein [Theileria equi strain WA]|eukprot:XP_004832487.1 conserved hypothetical protein [Theileria equi strain WA]